jgi:glycogen debranching enzyme
VQAFSKASSKPATTSSIVASEHSSDYISNLLLKVGITDSSKVLDFVVPRMLKAVDYLKNRDIDNDGLLEQNHNEDWMDTILKAGKIVYSQACWILVLSNLSSLLSAIGRTNKLGRIKGLRDKAISAVNEKLWSEEDGCYLDVQETHHIGGPYRTLTQDVSLYLVAITENTTRDSLRVQQIITKKKERSQKFWIRLFTNGHCEPLTQSRPEHGKKSGR